MKLAALTVAAVLVFPLVAVAGETDGWKEADYQRVLCAGMKLEVRLSEFGRADCVSETHAIEVDWADKFKEGVGQALTYATSTALIPGVILVCRRNEKSCHSASLTAQETFSVFGIEATVWECGANDTKLSDCAERNIAPRAD